MNISKVSLGVVCGTLMTGTLTSCYNSKYADKAKAEAVKYLDGYKLLKAERFASQQTDYDKNNGEAIAYWDSLLTEAKAKEAYIKGQQLIKDSINGIHYRKIKYQMPLDTVITESDIIDNARKEYAKYSNALEFIKSRDNAPKDHIHGYISDLATTTHYWNLINMAGKQHDAYQKGMADERAKIGK